MRRFLDQFSRYFVAIVLLISGLVKLNDPIGTEIKMEEYFEVFAQDFGSFFEVFIPWSLEIGMFMIVLELVLGVALLINFRMQLTTWTLLLMMLFFTFLTFYSAYFNKVTDCGCFGDAIKFTPWQSFTKDIVLMVFVLHLFWHRRRYQPVLRKREGNFTIIGATLLFIFVGVYAIRHLPFVDFRPYKVGNNIPQQMVPPEQPIIEYVFVKDGKTVNSKSFLSADDGYQYQSSRVTNADAIKPPITDYSVFTVDGEDITQQTFQGIKLLIVMHDVRKSDLNNVDALRKLTRALEGKVEMLILTSSTEQQIDAFRHEQQIAVPFAFADATVLKTIIRSNPGVTLWQDGTVLGKWHHNDIPDALDIAALLP